MTPRPIRLALDAVEADHVDGLVLPVRVLRDQVARIQAQRRACQFAEVATDLPGLIRDLYTTLATSADHSELLELAVHLHMQVTRMWLVHAAAPTDLVRRTVFLAQRLAQERDEIITLAVATFGVADVLLAGGAFQLARAKLDSSIRPPTTTDTAGLVAVVTTSHALIAALNRRPGDGEAPMDAAAYVAEQFGATGEADAQGIAFGPVDTGIVRIWLALEADEPDQAVSIAQDVHPEQQPFAVNHAHYWMHYGRELARLRGRWDDAVREPERAQSADRGRKAHRRTGDPGGVPATGPAGTGRGIPTCLQPTRREIRQHRLTERYWSSPAIVVVARLPRAAATDRQDCRSATVSWYLARWASR